MSRLGALFIRRREPPPQTDEDEEKKKVSFKNHFTLKLFFFLRARRKLKPYCEVVEGVQQPPNN